LAYVQKVVREAKEHTSWLSPNVAFEEAVEAFVTGVLDDPVLVEEVAAYSAGVAAAGDVNSLAQVVLRLVGPGVPDTYQGTELWDRSLVDPDNRRPVDYSLREELLDLLEAHPAAVLWSDFRAIGLPKLLVVQRGLALRRRLPEAFEGPDTYRPLDTRGPRAQHALAFLRGDRVAAVVPRLPLQLGGDAADVEVAVPAGSWSDVLTGDDIRSSGWCSLAEVTSSFPVAVLERVDA
jgi:(1->4)-alpha-D-glucan 1-alpha-D-glucosylmutase